MSSPQGLRLARATGIVLVLAGIALVSPIQAQRASPPSGLQVTGTAASATVIWQPVKGAVSYSVKRWKQDDPKCCSNSVEGLERASWTDEGSAREGFAQAGIYVFEVTAQFEGASAAATLDWTLAAEPRLADAKMVPTRLRPAVATAVVAAPVTSPTALPVGGTAAPAPVMVAAPVASTASPAPPPAPPTSISFTGTPSTARVHWGSPSGDLSGLKSYSVERWKQDEPECCRRGVDGLASNEWLDASGLQHAGVYVYRVSAVYADGRRASAEASFNHPEPQNPTAISYSRASPSSLKLSWHGVADAAYYKIWGAASPDTGQWVAPCSHYPSQAERAWAASHGLPITLTCDVIVPAVKDSGAWMVGAFYQPGDVSSPSSSFARLTLTPPTPAPAPVVPKYRVSITGFRVNHETVDDQLSLDGRGDEVYISVVVLEPIALKPSASWTARSQLIESKVFGDRNNAPDRIKAGSRSSDGGLQTGDEVTMPDPLVVWDGPVTTPILVVPTVWEWDGAAILGIQSAWYARMRPPSGGALNGWSQFYNTAESFEYPDIQARGWQELMGNPLCGNCYIGTSDAHAYGTFENPMIGYTRPIAVQGGFMPFAVSVSRANLDKYLGSNNSATFPVTYRDNGEGAGDYTLTMRFERVP